MALDEFLVWFQQAPWPGFTKATLARGGYPWKPPHRPSRGEDGAIAQARHGAEGRV
jgi:hypothetical protein